MVDYAIYLEPNKSSPNDDISTPLSRSISSLITEFDQSINHTAYYSLRHRPLAISIETKTETRTTEEAKVQLGIWVAAQIGRIRYLIMKLPQQNRAPSPAKGNLKTASPKKSTKKAKSQKKKDPASKRSEHLGSILSEMVFPLIYVQSEKWEIFFALPSSSPLSDTRITIYSSLVLGDSSSVFGTYQILRGLRIIEHWIDTKVRAWWEGLMEVSVVA